MIRRRLVRVSAQLRRAREELEIADAQLRQCLETEDEARIAALVSENPLSQRELTAAQRHREAMQRTRDAAAAETQRLAALQSELLERLPLDG